MLVPFNRSHYVRSGPISTMIVRRGDSGGPTWSERPNLTYCAWHFGPGQESGYDPDRFRCRGAIETSSPVSCSAIAGHWASLISERASNYVKR